MGLVLDHDQALLRNTANDFASQRLPVTHLRRLRDTRDATGFDREAWTEMAGLGWTGMLIPEALGGNGFGYFGLGLVFEALGRTLAASPLYSTVGLSGTALGLVGDDPRAHDLLRAIAAGESVVAFAHEEHARHRPWSIATTARRDGDGWLLDGRKRFVADGHVADALVLVARTSGGPDDLDGLSLFVVDGSAPGVTRRRLSLADSRNHADVELSNVRVSGSALLGAEGGAGAVLARVLDVGRILLAAEMFGMAQQAFETTLDYLKQRQQFGVPIGSFQALQHRAVQMYTEIELSRSVLYEALTALDDGRWDDVPRLASVCKALLNDTLHLVSNEAVQMHGGIGMTDQVDVGLYLKRARVAEAMLGTSAFHRERYADLQRF
ncbi:MAG TPA: acyl-CoA dehydrogenase family protein [Steroidobacteraceae bacterium]|nr:acyl-CoA dehydrogenase family protein [Steroidobacteraceae bacterium]